MGATDDSSETDVESQTHDKIGFSKDQIAIGIDPEDVLQWLGTQVQNLNHVFFFIVIGYMLHVACHVFYRKDELVTKFEEDNPQFDNERAEEEVIKFMMDGEMVNECITFE